MQRHLNEDLIFRMDEMMKLPENSGLEGTKYEIKMISKKPLVY